MAYKLRENEDESTDQGFQDSPKQGIQYEKTDVVISGNEDTIKKLTDILQNEEKLLDAIGRYAISFARKYYPKDFVRKYGPSIPPPQLKGLANRIKIFLDIENGKLSPKDVELLLPKDKLSPKDISLLGFKNEEEVYDYYSKNPSFAPKPNADEMIEFSKNSLKKANKDLFTNIKYGKKTIEIPYKGNIDYITNVIKSIGNYKISTKTNIKETIRKYVKEAIQRA